MYIISIQKHHYDSVVKMIQMFDGLFIDLRLTAQRSSTLHKRILQHGLYHLGLLGAFDKGSEE